MNTTAFTEATADAQFDGTPESVTPELVDWAWSVNADDPENELAREILNAVL